MSGEVTRKAGRRWLFGVVIGSVLVIGGAAAAVTVSLSDGTPLTDGESAVIQSTDPSSGSIPLTTAVPAGDAQGIAVAIS